MNSAGSALQATSCLEGSTQSFIVLNVLIMFCLIATAFLYGTGRTICKMNGSIYPDRL